MARPLQAYKQIHNAKESYFLQEVKPVSIPAPVGGWDGISPLANMKPEFAVTLENIVPRPGWVELRGGRNTWAQTLGSTGTKPVETLMTYRPILANEKLFAISDLKIYDVSTYQTPTVSVSNLLGNSRFQHCNFTTAGTSYIVACNGSNPVLNFNGTTWSNPAITGVTSNNLIHVHPHMSRLWFVEKQTTNVWYLGTGSISGAATKLDVGQLISKGSYVLATTTWTVDGGNGPNALFVIITNRGQVVIYQGQDPANATAWTVVGVFEIATPIGVRCVTRIGSDVAIITNQGVIPLSKSLPFNPASDRTPALTGRIQNPFLQFAIGYGANFGWEVTLFPAQTLMLVNIPTIENSTSVQCVMNVITGAWCKFTNWNANTFALYNESLYYGDNNGSVHLAYTGKTDLASSIVADCKSAFNFFDSPGRLKNMTMLKPYIVTDGSFTPTLSVDADFADNSPTSNVITVLPAGGVWDVSLWDATTWSGGTIAQAFWQSVAALGTALATRIKINYGGTTGANSINSIGLFDSGLFDTATFDGTQITSGSNVNLPTVQIIAFEAIVQPGGPA